MTETASADYDERTRLNVRDSDATLVFCYGEPTGGTAFTVDCAGSIGRPSLVLNLDAFDVDAAVELTKVWLTSTAPRVLNVAGPRLSEEPRIDAAVGEILRRVLAR